MKYATMRYVDDGRTNHLELHCFDGTKRGVVFRDATCKGAALRAGRADIDCTAIQRGMLPRGATLVSPAGARSAEEVPRETRAGTRVEGQSDPLAAVRIRFSLQLLVDRSEYITEDEDAKARQRDPDNARIYEGIVDELERGDETQP